MARKEAKKGLSLDVPMDMYNMLKTHAEEDDITISQFIRWLIRDYFESRDQGVKK